MPEIEMEFHKYHALGNDYLVIEPRFLVNPSVEIIQKICHRNFGIGSDGILLGPLSSKGKARFKVRIFNPDGSEAEKSGNGLRIFSRFLYDQKLVGNNRFSIETIGGIVKSKVLGQGENIEVDMGRVSFIAKDIPMKITNDISANEEVINKIIRVGENELTISAANIGNPHCIVLVDKALPEIAKDLGPLLEKHSVFPNKTNVQILEVMDRNNIKIEIWERGAGYTLASGSSSSASAAVVKRLGLCDSKITVHMPGGRLYIQVKDDYKVKMTGPVVNVSHGVISSEIF